MGDLSVRLSQLSPEARIIFESRLAARANRPTVLGIPRRASGDAIRLSFSQRRIWYLEQLNPGTATYNAPYAFRGQGKIDLDAFCRAVNLVVERHIVLRTKIGVSQTGEPICQVVLKWNAVEVHRMTLSGELAEQEAVSLVEVSAQKCFNISCDPMLRVDVALISDVDFIILLTAHHIAWDGVSKGVVFRELGIIYDAIISGKESDLPPLRVEYADYALWQQRSFSGVKRDTEVAYWKRQLTGAPPYIDIPLDKPRPAVQRFHGAKIAFTLPDKLLKAAEAFGRAEKTTMYATLLAAFKVFLLAFTGQVDICIATPFAGRGEPETQDVVGFFTNTVILRTCLDAKCSFREILARVRNSVLDAQDHQSMPMDQLMEVLQPPRDLSRMPLAQVNFRLQGGKPPELKLRGLKLTQMSLIDTLISKFDMALEVGSAETEPGYVEYNTDLFTHERMSHIPGAYEALLEQLIASPDASVGQLAAFGVSGTLSPKRRRIALASCNPKIESRDHA